jgi:hypothetical protein
MAASAFGLELGVGGKASQADARQLFGAHLSGAEELITRTPDHERQSNQQGCGASDAEDGE